MVKNKKRLVWLALLPVFFVAACTPSRYVKPLPADAVNLTFAAGGALFDFQGNTIPFPLTSVVAGYGVNQNLTAWGALHTTAAAYGVLQTEFGAVKKVYQGRQAIPSVSVAPSVQLMVDKWQGAKRLYPVVDVNFYWENIFKNDLLYVGVNNWFDLSQLSANQEQQTRNWIGSLQTGYSYQPNKMQYTLEVKYIAPNISNENIVVDYTGINNKGALGVYFSVGKSF